jgi:hypothetical protein
MRLSPANVITLLTLYGTPVAIPRPGEQEDAFVGCLLSDGIIKLSESGNWYEMTEKGNKWVEMICNTPQPESRWVDPREGK